MKYICLVYHDEQKLAALSPAEHDSLAGEALACREELRRSGHYVASGALQHAQTAATIRVRDGKLSVTGGPFAATQEQLAGFYLIDARDLNVAIRLASRLPPARSGCIEVRPVKEFDYRNQTP